jgi:hypothetical protein
MSSILSSVLLSAGKQIVGGLAGSNNKEKVNKSEQLERFDRRLDSVVNPEKTAFKTFLSDNYAGSKSTVEYLQKRLKDGLLSEPGLSGFVVNNGGSESPLTIEKSDTGYTLKDSAGEVYDVETGSEMEAIVDKLYYLESVLQLAAVDPTMTIDKAVDLSFEKEQLSPNSQITLS